MPRVDDYKMARDLAIKYLKELSVKEIKTRTLYETKEDDIFIVPFLGEEYEVTYPSFIFRNVKNPDREPSLIEQILILHYFKSVPFVDDHYKWISFREIPGTGFYYSAFLKRAIDPLKKVFGREIDKFIKASEILKGKKLDVGDAGFEFWVFPRVPIQLILWEGDDEFPPDANILFRSSVDMILSPEDIVWAASLLVYKMIGILK